MKNIHILPTKNKSRLSKGDAIESYFYCPDNQSPYEHAETYQQMYITSDEEIKRGDWFLWKDTEDPYLFKCIGLTDTDSLQVENSLTKKIGTYNRDPKYSDYGDWYRCYSKKIILTTDPNLINKGVQPIDDEFLQWFVENPTCDFVEVVDETIIKEEWIDDSEGGEIYQHQFCGYKIILPKKESLVDKLKNYFNTTSDEQIQKDWDNTVKQIEGIESPTLEEFSDKLSEVTLEQAALKYYEKYIDDSNIPKEHYEYEIQDLMKGFAYNWHHQQSKNMYSEQEVYELLKKALTHQDNGDTGSLITAQGEIRLPNFNSWFEQNKK